MRRRFLTVGAVALLAMGTVSFSPTPQASQGPALFSSPSLRIPATQAAVPQPGPDDVRYLRSRLVLADAELLASTPTARGLTFNLFDDVTLEVVFDQVIRRGRRGHSFIGHVVGEHYSTVLLEQLDAVMVGAVQIPGGRYALRFAGNGLHSVHEVNPAAFSYHLDDFIDVAPTGEILQPTPRQARAKRTFVYVGLYTDAALEAQGGKKAMKLVARATTTWLAAAFKAQRIKHKIKFKGIKRVKGSDPRDLSVALNRVTDQTDGEYDEAGSIRDKKKADFVGLYTVGDGTGFGSCGLGWRPFAYSASNDRFAYHAVREDCNVVGGGKTGAHEWLHNMGGCHPNAAGDSCFNGPNPTGSAHGFIVTGVLSVGVAHTTLGTGAICSRCADLLTVSGRKKFKGDKVKDKVSDIAKLINNGADIYFRYR